VKYSAMGRCLETLILQVGIGVETLVMDGRV